MNSDTTTTKPAKKKKPTLRSDLKPVWCPGCGDYGVIAGVDQALTALEYKGKDVVFVSGIGCSSRLPYFFNTYGFHTIHGRAPAVAIGVKCANPDLRVIVVGGDGDFFSIGTNHIIHAARRNVDMLAICMDNHIYGLTKGQVSPTSAPEFISGSTPYGSVEASINPVMMALTAGATFVAQCYSAKVKHLKETVIAAEKHKGFSFVNVISPCPTFNKVQTFAHYKSRVTITEEDAKADLCEAYKFVLDHESDKILGTFFQVERPTFDGSQVAMAAKAEKDLGVPTMDDILESFA